jgi:hypothetical protein
LQGLVASDIQGLSGQSLKGLVTDTSTVPKPFETAKAVAFVDSLIADSDVLIKDLQAKGIKTFVINHESDGLTQMANDVRGMSDISSIHVFSHANSGMLAIGSGAVDLATLATHTNQLTQIGQSLSNTGDILLYGCDVAANQVVQNFIAALAQATGADIAASLDETGTKSLGGNWVLLRSNRSQIANHHFCNTDRFIHVICIERDLPRQLHPLASRQIQGLQQMKMSPDLPVNGEDSRKPHAVESIVDEGQRFFHMKRVREQQRNQRKG